MDNTMFNPFLLSEPRVLICHRADQDAIGRSAPRLSHLLRLSRRGRCRSYVRDEHPLLPNAALTNSDRCMIALVLFRIAALDLPGHTPFSVFPHLIAICTYSVRGIRIRIVVRSVIVAEMHILEQIFVMFLDGLPTVHRS